MLNLHDFSSRCRCYAKATLASDRDLSKLLCGLLDDGERWVYDFDPLWREVVVFAEEGDVFLRLECMLERTDAEAGTLLRGPLGVEIPAASAEGIAKRSYERNKRMHTAEVVVSVEPGEPGSGLRIDCFDSVYAPVLLHGARRAARQGPVARFPITSALLRIRSAFAEQSAPALADLHAAATHAASRAFQAAALKVHPSADQPGETEELLPFPDLENSVADTFANLLELFAYPVDALSEEEREQLGSFIAYQLSLLFGHQLDARMRRMPKKPPLVLQRLLGQLAGELASRIDADGRPGARMVGGLLQLWVEEWLPAPLPSPTGEESSTGEG